MSINLASAHCLINEIEKAEQLLQTYLTQNASLVNSQGLKIYVLKEKSFSKDALFVLLYIYLKRGFFFFLLWQKNIKYFFLKKKM